MPLVQVHVAGAPDEAQVLELMRRITDVVEGALEVPRQSIRVIVSEVPTTRWSVGGVPLAAGG